ncbi:MAG: hypothetical protein JW738_10385 [Actinobacteria bacterium]|nr:hypothetical protein [Actinomycetota bacterium]
MAKQKYCRECGVPKLIHKGLSWQNNGIITETKNPDHRMLFTESDNLEALFKEIENIMGVPIEKFVIESKRRVTKEYLENMIPAPVLKILYALKPDLIIKRMEIIGRSHGYGNIQPVDIRKHTEKGDYLRTTIEHPYSILFYRGDILGGMEASTRRDCTTRATEIDTDKYLLEIWTGDHPPELKERMKPKIYPVKAGNFEMERCSLCGAPLAVAAYDFDYDSGVIKNPETGTRMALFGPVGLQSVFTALEEELGDTIPETIIEAERRYSKEHLRVRDWVAGEENLRCMMAMRGYGILNNFEADLEHFAITIQNPAVVHLLVGMAKGVFERAMKVDSSIHEWSISEDGELSITVRKEN